MAIKNLIKLDFYAMKPLVRIMIIFLIIPIILGIVADLGASILVTLTFSAFMLNVIFSITEKSNFYKLYGILPVRMTQCIISRYLFSSIVVVFAGILSFANYIILSLALNGIIDWKRGGEFLALSMLIAFLFISIQYPFYFRFEYSKAMIMSILPYVLCFAIGVPLTQYLMKNDSFRIIIMGIIKYFSDNILVMLVSGITISMLVMTISCIISIKIRKKEI